MKSDIYDRIDSIKTESLVESSTSKFRKQNSCSPNQAGTAARIVKKTNPMSTDCADLMSIKGQMQSEYSS